jgi:alkylmercury lyase
MATATDRGDKPSVEIRPGVNRPDWSVLTSPQACQALAGRLASRSGLLDRWAIRLEADADLVWRTIVRRYAELGYAPTRTDIVAAGRIPGGDIETLLDTLRSHDLIDLDLAGEVKLAYPFTQTETGHRIHVGGNTLNALCAIDALGVAAMLQMDIAISSNCHRCGEAVQVVTGAEGKALKSSMPVDAVVWYDFAYDGSAATSCCPAITFFCSDEHRRRWLQAQTPQRRGIDLAMNEALQVGQAIFGPVLMDNGPSQRLPRPV